MYFGIWPTRAREADHTGSLQIRDLHTLAAKAAGERARDPEISSSKFPRPLARPRKR